MLTLGTIILEQKCSCKKDPKCPLCKGTFVVLTTEGEKLLAFITKYLYAPCSAYAGRYDMKRKP